MGAKRSKSLASAGSMTLGNYGIQQPMQYDFGGSGFESAFDNILPKDEINRNKLYRRIYKYDSVSGAAVDLMALLPFSDLSLAGVEDKAVMRVFQDTMEQLNIQTLVPQIATEYLIIGKVIGTLVFNDSMGVFTDIITQDPDFCTTEAIPLQGYDPKVDLRVPPEFRQFLTSRDPRDLDARSELPKELIRRLLSGKVALDPMTTLYLSRKTYPNDMGTSYLSRVVPFFILEQLLLEGTISGAQRRQRAIMHIQAGSEDWEPSQSQLEELIEMFVAADLDPVGAVVATKRDVDVSEVKQGGDFWKVTDEWDSLTQAKMRSLGINESFLCLKKGELIPTENGIFKIEDIYPEWKTLKKNEAAPIDIKVKGFREGKHKAAKFWYRGFGHTYSVNTYNGYNVDATADHKFLILGDELRPTWKKAGKLQEGDFLFIDTRGEDIRNKEPLALNLDIVLPKTNEKNPDPKKPAYMTTDLAYLIGCIISDGKVGDYGISFYNSNEKLVGAFVDSIHKVFGDHNEVDVKFTKQKGKEYEILGIMGTCKEDRYSVRCLSSIIRRWMIQLGVKSKESIDYVPEVGEKYNWKFEEIPWCILQADRECQYAFVAGMVDGDGSVQRKGDIIIYRKSSLIRKQFMVLFSNLGFPSFIVPDHPNSVRVTANHGKRLYNKIQPYMSHSYKNTSDVTDSGYHRTIGIPIEPLRIFLRSRYIGREQNVGEWFEDDMGFSILIRKWAGRFSKFLGNVVGESKVENGKLLLYSSYDEGKYDDLIEAISSISTSVGSRLRALFELRYKFDTFSHRIKSYEKEHLFDLSMGNGITPAYQSSGIIISNSGDATYNCLDTSEIIDTKEMGSIPIGKICDTGGDNYKKIDLTVRSVNGWEKADMWHYTGEAPTLILKTASGKSITCTPKHRLYLEYDLMDFAKNIKVGEKILCKSDAGVLYKDVVISIEDGGVRPVFDLSMARGTSHSFLANGIVSANTMEAALSVFIETLRAFRFFITQRIFYYKLFPILAKVHRFIKRKQSELDHNIRITGSAKDIPVKDLIMPEIQWHKQLAPSYDESYFSILSSVQEQGLPIPLRVWAAAGGFSIEKLLDGLDDDIEVRKKLGEYKEKLKELPGAGGEEEEAGWGSVGDSALKTRKKQRALKVISNAERAANSEVASKEADRLLRLTNTKNLPASKIVVGEFS